MRPGALPEQIVEIGLAGVVGDVAHRVGIDR